MSTKGNKGRRARASGHGPRPLAPVQQDLYSSLNTQETRSPEATKLSLPLQGELTLKVAGYFRDRWVKVQCEYSGHTFVMKHTAWATCRLVQTEKKILHAEYLPERSGRRAGRFDLHTSDKEDEVLEFAAESDELRAKWVVALTRFTQFDEGGEPRRHLSDGDRGAVLKPMPSMLSPETRRLDEDLRRSLPGAGRRAASAQSPLHALARRYQASAAENWRRSGR